MFWILWGSCFAHFCTCIFDKYTPWRAQHDGTITQTLSVLLTHIRVVRRPIQDTNLCTHYLSMLVCMNTLWLLITLQDCIRTLSGYYVSNFTSEPLLGWCYSRAMLEGNFLLTKSLVHTRFGQTSGSQCVGVNTCASSTWAAAFNAHLASETT